MQEEGEPTPLLPTLASKFYFHIHVYAKQYFQNGGKTYFSAKLDKKRIVGPILTPKEIV